MENNSFGNKYIVKSEVSISGKLKQEIAKDLSIHRQTVYMALKGYSDSDMASKILELAKKKLINEVKKIEKVK